MQAHAGRPNQSTSNTAVHQRSNTMAISSTSGPGQVNNLNLQEFLKILTSQLSNQDPLKPLDNQEFVAQLAQFSTLEQSTQLNAKIDQMLEQQAVTGSVGLLGRNVGVGSGGANGGPSVTGRVSAIQFVSGQAQLTVTQSNGAVFTGVTLDQITSAQ
ncbi:flagellar hook assembly protein FlgD [Massilia antarctica]|nr:flagellar hook capping FlgD N-terminal domain-containing protein [Massilia antarctica]